MKEWDEVVERYVGEYEARGMCPSSVRHVRGELDQWVAWIRHRRPRPKLCEVGGDLVVRYVACRGAFKSKATVSAILSKLRGLGEFLVREGVWQTNPLRWMRGPRLHGCRVPRRLNQEAMEHLWQAATKARGSYAQRLWLGVLGVLYGTGARRGEIARLDACDWDREEGVLKLDGRKTGWERRVPVPELTARCLEAYLGVRGAHLERLGVAEEPALFVNCWGGRLSETALTDGMKRLRERSGVRQVTLHWFRHSCASDLLEGGARIPEVQRFLGHRWVGSTMQYVHVADPQRQRAAELHPINAMLREETGDE
jgi:integrase/recombinase XerD